MNIHNAPKGMHSSQPKMVGTTLNPSTGNVVAATAAAAGNYYCWEEYPCVRGFRSFEKYTIF